MKVAYSPDQTKVWLSFDYDPALIVRLKRGVKVGRVWHKTLRMWEIYPVMLPQLVATFPEADYVGEELQETVARYRKSMLSRKVKDAPQPVHVALKLYPFQKAGVYSLNPLDTGILADDPGLGKTIQSIVWAVEKGKGPRLCIVPAAVKLNWEREIRRARPKDDILVIGTENTSTIGKLGRMFGAPDWVIVNYELVAHKGMKAKRGFATDESKNRKCRGCGGILPNNRSSSGVHEALCCHKFETLLLDEAHFIKNLGAQRTKGTLAISRGIKNKLAITGTPIINRPIELFPILLALHRMDQTSYWSFVEKFCDPKKKWVGRGKQVWDLKGASNLDELKEFLRPFMIRRLKSDVLKELPEKIYTDMPVEYDDRKEYSRAEMEYVKALGTGNVLGALQNLRVVSARQKVKATREILETVLEEGKKALVFCCYLEPLHVLADMFKSSVLLTGEERPEARQLTMDKFQENQFCRLAFCSTMAAGTGVNLTAAEKVIFVDLPWTPAVKSQAEDRAHRIGQKGSVEVITLLGRDGIDTRMQEILGRKGQIIDGAIPFMSERDMYRELEESYEEVR